MDLIGIPKPIWRRYADVLIPQFFALVSMARFSPGVTHTLIGVLPFLVSIVPVPSSPIPASIVLAPPLV
jgi:hypothetical protein